MTSAAVPLVHYFGDRYFCLRDHRYAHAVTEPKCDCMRRKRPALPFRALGGVLGVIGWFAWMGGTGLAVALKTADERLRGAS